MNILQFRAVDTLLSVLSGQLSMNHELRTLEKFRPDEVFVLLDILHASLVLNDLLLKDIFDLQLLLELASL